VGNKSVRSLRPITALAAAAAFALVPASAVLAQRPQPTPEQRLDRLERQVQEVQRQVFPRGRPAATSGFSDEPAASQSSVATLGQRLDALERQMADMLRQSEENGHRLQTLEADVARLRTDQEQRISTLEQRMSEAASSAAVAPATVEPTAGPKPTKSKPPSNKLPGAKPPGTGKADPPTGSTSSAAATPAGDPGEDAYTEGFKLWEAGKDDDAITSLRAFTSAYPKHRRISYANNLIGRALLDKGQARAAAEAFLANYRNNPAGERASDSLYYLGQALMKLGQPGQACKAYAELEAVYGSKVRPDLKKQVTDAKTQAQCG
jgi:TolA-binding protein